MHGAPSKATVQLPLATTTELEKQSPTQKHSQLNHSTVRSRTKKKMSRKINLSIELMNKRC